MIPDPRTRLPTPMHRHRRIAASPIVRAIVLGALAALAQGVVDAADKVKAPPPAKSATPILTPAQLKECLAQRDRLKAQTDAVVKTKAEIAVAQADIDSSGAALASEAATLDRTSAEAVNAYNAKVVARNEALDDFRTKANAYNKDAEDVIAARETFEKACENRRYDDRDLADIQKKR